MNPSGTSVTSSRALPPHRTHGTKRKRPASDLPPDVLNPLSYRPGTLKQFAVAGLSERESIPSLAWPGFPHKAYKEPESEDAGGGWEGTAWSGADEDDGLGGEGSDEARSVTGRGGKRRTKTRTEMQQVMEAVIDDLHIWLSEGRIRVAKKAMAGLLRLKQPNRTNMLDMRRHHLWGLAAEIIMRDGEDRPGGHESEVEKDPDEPRRWGLARNVPELRRFLGTLIVRHPYDRTRPTVLCAVDFWWALLSTEVYSVHAEQTIALYRLEKRAREWEEQDSLLDEPLPNLDLDDDEEGDPMDQFPPAEPPPRRENLQERHARERDRIRLRALEEIGDVLRRLEPLMGMVGYKSDKEMLSLHGTTLLYFADLHVPAYVGSQEVKDGALKERDAIRERARRVLTELLRVGGEVDYKLQHFLDMDAMGMKEEDDE